MFAFPLFRGRLPRPALHKSAALRRRPRLEILDDRITPTVSSIVSNFNGTAMAAGSTLWFNSVFKVSGLGPQGATLFVSHGSVLSSAFGAATPDAVITFSPTATSAATTFDAGSNTWFTTVPMGLGGNTFMAGFALPLPNGLPGGLNPVTWTADFATDTPGASVNWQWSTAVYRSFSTDYSALGVKPVDSNSASQYHNSDHAGTPENFKSFVTGGARGGGGSNFTGSYSATGHVTPEIVQPPSGGNADIGGTVFEDVVHDGVFNGVQDPDEFGIQGVELDLTGTDLNGNTVSMVTHTDDLGHYSFSGLAAGTYQIFEVQPPHYLDGGDSVGTVGGQVRGVKLGQDLIGQITLSAGDHGVEYNFAEIFDNPN
jgi:SdrD B-like domain